MPAVDFELVGIIAVDTPTMIPGCEDETGTTVLGFESLIGMLAVRLALGGITVVGMIPLDDAGFGVGIGTVAVKVVWSLEKVIGTELGGVTILVGAPPKALEMALIGFVTGTSVMKVVSGCDTVTGNDKTGEAPLDKPAVTLEMTAEGLVRGTLVVIVVSDCGITTGTDIGGAEFEASAPVFPVGLLPDMTGASEPVSGCAAVGLLPGTIGTSDPISD